jgi:hypothetical protein
MLSFESGKPRLLGKPNTVIRGALNEAATKK